jgi:hypothetical protein
MNAKQLNICLEIFFIIAKIKKDKRQKAKGKRFFAMSDER